MGRAPCCEKVGLKRGRWTAEEDEILTKYIQANGEGSWRSLPKNAGLLRCGKSCRLRWINYLRSDLKRGNITAAEEEIVIKLHATLGNRWSVIAGHLPGRTDNEIKNYWNSHLSRKIDRFRRSSANDTSPVVVMDIAKAAGSTEKRRGGRTSRLAMRKNKEYLPISPPKFQEPPKETEISYVTVPMPTTPTLEKEALSSAISWPEENIGTIFTDPCVKDHEGLDNVGCVAQPPTSVELESSSSMLQPSSKHGEDSEVLVAYEDNLCFDDIMVDGEIMDANGILTFHEKEENNGLVTDKETAFGTIEAKNFCNWAPSENPAESGDLGSSHIETAGEWHAYSPFSLEAAAGGSDEDVAMLSWLLDADNCEEGKCNKGVEMDAEKQNAMVAWLLS